MSKMVQGVVHGRTIELSEDIGVEEGQRVVVSVTVLPQRVAWGAGLQRAAGALADEWSDEDDRILSQIHADRQQDSRREINE